MHNKNASASHYAHHSPWAYTHMHSKTQQCAHRAVVVKALASVLVRTGHSLW